jgi:hypothetical protein
MNLLPAFALLMLTGSVLAATPNRSKDEEPPEVRYAAMLEREYGPLGKTTEQILGREKTHQPPTIVGALLYRIRAKPPERQSVIEKRLVAARDVLDEVSNGGFSQYFGNAAGDHAALALQAFKDMGATELAKQMQRAMAVFPQGKPPTDTTRRIKVMEQVRRKSQAVWGGCEDAVYLQEEGFADLALAYAKKNRAQILLP